MIKADARKLKQNKRKSSRSLQLKATTLNTHSHMYGDSQPLTGSHRTMTFTGQQECQSFLTAGILWIFLALKTPHSLHFTLSPSCLFFIVFYSKTDFEITINHLAHANLIWTGLVGGGNTGSFGVYMKLHE